MDKTVLITAGAKRMGKSFAKAMLKKKWSIVLHYNKSKKEAEETAHYLFKKGGKVTLYKANFLDNEQTDKFIEKLRKENKDWKCLINNASMFQYDLGESFDIDTLNKHMLVNALNQFIEKGKFMNMPDCGYYNAPIVYTIPLQILAYEVACSIGTDLDQPRNLAKSVTVE